MWTFISNGTVKYAWLSIKSRPHLQILMLPTPITHAQLKHPDEVKGAKILRDCIFEAFAIQKKIKIFYTDLEALK